MANVWTFARRATGRVAAILMSQVNSGWSKATWWSCWCKRPDQDVKDNDFFWLDVHLRKHRPASSEAAPSSDLPSLHHSHRPHPSTLSRSQILQCHVLFEEADSDQQ